MRPPGVLKPEDFEKLTDEELHQVRRESEPGSHYRDWADLEVERRERIKPQPAPRKWKFADIPHPIQIGLMLLGIGCTAFCLWLSFGRASPQVYRPSAPAESTTHHDIGTTPPPSQ